MDVDGEKIRLLNQGRMPIYEPGLESLVVEEQARGHLRFVDSYEMAVPGAEAIFICVGTPSLPDGRADTSAVGAAARAVGEHLGHEYCVIINKSTVPIGSGDWVGMLVREGAQRQAVGNAGSEEHEEERNREDEEELAAASYVAGSGSQRTRAARLSAPWSAGAPPASLAPEVCFDVVSNPEFLREGSAIADTASPDRIVIGAESERAVARMQELYAPLLAQNAARGREVPLIVTDRASAEMIKYAANAFLAAKISFINEIANLCECVGADVLEVARGIGMDARIGSDFLAAGIGWGGSCFPKDLASLVQTAREYGYDARLLDSVRDVNRAQRGIVIRKLQERLKLIKGKRIALWGLAFKPGTDDMRDAPALEIAARLGDLGAAVRAYDPQAMPVARRLGAAVRYCADPYEAAEDASAIVLVTEWPDFRLVDWPRLRRMMQRPLIVDGRNTLDRAALLWHGFEYCGIGR
jgi:UDPglucose 6-dehydrogenase